uniref:Uncharacterized protein n=1 Tax=Craspedostauros australis TaxID=1486917 RepID=A0A7R9WSL4_9STRA
MLRLTPRKSFASTSNCLHLSCVMRDCHPSSILITNSCHHHRHHHYHKHHKHEANLSLTKWRAPSIRWDDLTDSITLSDGPNLLHKVQWVALHLFDGGVEGRSPWHIEFAVLWPRAVEFGILDGLV